MQRTRGKRRRKKNQAFVFPFLFPKNSIDPDLSDFPLSSTSSLSSPLRNEYQQHTRIHTHTKKKKQGLALVAAVDCSSKTNQALCAEHVKVGYPTFKSFGAIPQNNPYNPGVPFKDSKVIDKQPLLPKHLVEATLAGLPESLVMFVSDLKALEAARATAKEQNLPVAVLFTSKAKAPPLFRAVAAELRGRVSFVAASSSDDAVAESLFGQNADEKKAPALFVEPLSSEREEEGKATKKGTKEEEKKGRPPSSSARIRHAGPLTVEAMKLFLLPHAVSAVEAEGSEADGAASSSTAAADDRATPRVVELVSDEAALDDILSRPAATLLAFYDAKGKEKACNAELEAFNSAAVELGPLARAAAIDVSLSPSSKTSKPSKVDRKASSPLPASAVEQFLQKPGGGPVDGAAFAEKPCDLQIVGVPAGNDKGEPDEWAVLKKSDERKKGEKDIQPWASSRSLSRFITATFPHAAMPVESEQALAAMMTPPDAPPRTPGSATTPPRLRPVALLFSDKNSIPPLMHALATNFGPLGFGVGVVPASAEAMRKQFRVEKVPSLALAYMPPPEMTAAAASKKTSSNVPQGSLAVQGYRGPIKYALLDSWLRMAAPHVGVDLPPEATASAAAGLLRGGGVVGSAGKKSPLDDRALPEIKQALKPGDLAKICPPESKTLCVVVGLRGGSDPKRTRDPEALLAAKRVAAAWSEQPLTFVAVDASSSKRGGGGNGRAALSSLGVDPDEAPTAAVYSPAKLRSIPMPDVGGEPQGLSEKSLNSLLDSVFTGRAVTRPVGSRPEVEAGEVGASSPDDDDDSDDDESASSAPTVDVEAALKKSLKRESSAGSHEEL